MNLLALSLRKNLTPTKIAELLNIKFNKGIENGYYGFNEKLHVILLPFEVLAIIAEEKNEIQETLKTLSIGLSLGSFPRAISLFLYFIGLPYLQLERLPYGRLG